MRMRIRITVIGLLALAAVANAQRGPGPGARFLGAEVGIPGRVVKNAPFSADIVTETTQVLADGNRIKRTSTVRFARDSEGRTRREQSLQDLSGLAPNSNLPNVAFISDPVASTAYALDLGKRTARKSSLNPNPARSWPGGDPSAGPRAQTRDNVRTEALGRQAIEGVMADGTRTTMTFPAGRIGNEQPLQVVSETWYSPDLQTVVLRKRSDPRTGETVTRYTNVSRAEPPRTLFEPPVDFKLMESRKQ